MLETKNLRYQYSSGTSMSFPDIIVEKGKTRLVLGTSGCGKTTLLHLLGGILSLQDGDVSIEGTSLSDLQKKELDKFRGENLGFIFQKPHLISALTVEENLLIAQFAAGKPKNALRVKEVLEVLGLGNKSKAKTFELSEGQQQRVSIARAVINSPLLILADEPTSSLDDENCEKVIGLLKEVAEMNNSSLLITTHDSRLKEIISDQTILSAL